MKDSAGIRKQNLNMVRQLLQKGGAYTKQQIARETGLSVATCNTLLNWLEQEREVTGEKRQLSEVGRSTTLYRLSEDYESFLCMRADPVDGRRKLTIYVLSPSGRVLEQAEREEEQLDAAVFERETEVCMRRHPNISCLVLGICGNVYQGIIRHCDIPELNGVALRERMQKRFGLPVWMENDMHLRAYGYYKTCGNAEDVVTLAYFPENLLPGTASIHAGTVIRGSREFAGMVGFLSEGANRNRLPELMDRRTALPLIIRAAVSIAVMINPDRILFTGDLIDEAVLKTVRGACENMVPEEYLPEFIYEPDPFAYYTEGMYHRALDLRNGERAELSAPAMDDKKKRRKES